MERDRIEWVRPVPTGGRVRMALLDLDGTLSLIRAGWQSVMAEMMIQGLQALRTGEAPEALSAETREMIGATTGKPTAVQMEAYVSLIHRRGGSPPTVEDCLTDYKQRLSRVISTRKRAIARGDFPPDHYMVPGARAFLEELDRRGIRMVLASGTDHNDAVLEAELLQITRFFRLGICGAVPAPAEFTKERLVERLIAARLYAGDEMLAIGDGPAEIAAVAGVGGLAVGVASDEHDPGELDLQKRERLIAAGAHAIVADLSAPAALLDGLRVGAPGANGG